MAAIKKFFQKRKLDVKFKRAGEGHSLGEMSAPKSTRSPEAVPGPARTRGPGAEAMRAAEAALARQTSRDKQGKTQIQKKNGPTFIDLDKQFQHDIENIFLSISFNLSLGAQKNRLIETVLMSTHDICFG